MSIKGERKKIVVLNTGMIRPSVDRVINNISQNIELLSSKYPNYEFDHFNFYYPDINLQEEFELKCKEKGYNCNKLPTAEERAYTKGYVLFDNTYKCWKNLENSTIPNLSEYDAVIRNRLDYEILDIILPEEIEEDIIYAYQVNTWSIFDNFSVITPSTYKKLYNIKIVDYLFSLLKDKKIKFENNEQLLNLICFKENIQCKNISFELQGYQSNDDFWNGSPQWSKKDRYFKFVKK